VTAHAEVTARATRQLDTGGPSPYVTLRRFAHAALRLVILLQLPAKILQPEMKSVIDRIATTHLLPAPWGHPTAPIQVLSPEVVLGCRDCMHAPIQHHGCQATWCYPNAIGSGLVPYEHRCACLNPGYNKHHLASTIPQALQSHVAAWQQLAATARSTPARLIALQMRHTGDFAPAE
jgi:hypothetical protein